MTDDLHLVLAAAHYSAQKHSNQRRKGTAAEPYVNHLIEVAHLVSSASAAPDSNLLVAALLHDVIEDAGVTADAAPKKFRADVASLVLEVTDDKSLSNAERKRLQIEHAPHISERAQMIKLADKISNLRAMLDSPPAGWPLERRREYFLWAQQVVNALSAPNRLLQAEFEKVVGRFGELEKRSD